MKQNDKLKFLYHACTFAFKRLIGLKIILQPFLGYGNVNCKV